MSSKVNRAQQVSCESKEGEYGTKEELRGRSHVLRHTVNKPTHIRKRCLREKKTQSSRRKAETRKRGSHVFDSGLRKMGRPSPTSDLMVAAGDHRGG